MEVADVEMSYLQTTKLTQHMSKQQMFPALTASILAFCYRKVIVRLKERTTPHRSEDQRTIMGLNRKCHVEAHYIVLP